MKYLILTACILSCCVSHAQYGNPFTYDAGFGVGAMNCQTDVGGPSGKANSSYLNEINWSNTRFTFNAFIAANYKNLFGLRFEGMVGSVKAYDSILKGATVPSAKDRYNRNLSFQSPIRSINLVGEIHVLDLLKINTEFPSFSPYIAVGAGVCFFNPKTRYNNDWVKLQPLRTEGQGFDEYPDRKPYSLTATNFIFGGGFCFSTQKMVYRLEFLNYSMSTDYLDDVSTTYINPALFSKYLRPYQATVAESLYKKTIVAVPNGTARGNSANNDTYLAVMFKVGFNLFPDYGGVYRRVLCR